MDIIGIDTLVVERVARILRKNNSRLNQIDVCDTRFYPPCSEDVENTLRYFMTMVAMDHRLSRPGKPYEACIEDGCFKGSELLYRLGMKKYEEDMEFFNPVRLASITIEDIKKWLSMGKTSPPDIEIRAILLRDLGQKITKLYNGEVSKVLEMSGNRVYGDILSPGFVDNLRVFKAYEDPVAKKPLLLAKFLVKRGLFNPVDQLDVAVDNHLCRIAYRLGLVMVSGNLWEKIKRGIEVSWEEDVLLRLFVKRSYRLLSQRAGISPDIIDDHFWLMGRGICLKDIEPMCGRCMFKNTCRARNNASFMVNEHVHYNTWYY
ncbi:MAG: iron-sulfur cluster loop [Desulfurococcaceae archaeon]